MIKKMNVEVVCTTDDPPITLNIIRNLKVLLKLPVFPTFRPDNVIKTEDPVKFKAYIEKLEHSSGTEIKNFNALIEALDSRHKFFHEMGGESPIMGLTDSFMHHIQLRS